MAYPRSQLSRQFKFVKRTTNASAGNDYSTSSTTWVAVDSTNLPLTIAAQVGDVIFAELSARWNAGSGVQGFVDAATVVGGSATNHFTSGGASGEGNQGWFGPASAEQGCAGRAYYTVQSGDLVSGFVTVQPYYRLTGASARVLYCRADLPMVFTVGNLGPADPN